jgi:hypothetical protein|uniref:Uncharacterized protein n=1 Tax=Siphoviridae sp. ctoiW10 TaxID=2827592 RepID=A0A8S5LPN0_9CAUD|nr:MAG TPA: hypothetical protein [Siphoviridae sp. ctoiW10]
MELEPMDTAELTAQQERYDAIARATSDSLALFYCCIEFDRPFDMLAVPKEPDVGEKWVAYLDNLRLKKLDTRRGEPLGFLDGLTDITKIFGEGLSAGEFTKAVGNEKSARNRKVGTAQQRKNWGENSAKNPYTTEDYDELDRIYEALASDLMAAGGVSVKQEFILRDCAKMTLDRDKMRAIGQYDKAAKLNKMVQDNLSSEGLRKRDAKPIDDLRIDGIVDRLEKAGLLKNGKQCSPDEMFEILFHRRPKYSYTKDAAEQILLYMANTTRVNDGLSELPTLPPDMRLRDDLGEFAEEPDEQEKESYKELGIVKMPPVKKK